MCSILDRDDRDYSHRGIRVVNGSLKVVAWLGVLALGASACSSDDADDEATAEATNTQDIAEELDRQEVEALYERYWDLRVESENVPELLDGHYDGVIVQDLVEFEEMKIGRYQSMGLVRVGAPSVTDVEVEVDGDSARIVACLDEDEWEAEIEGEIVPPPDEDLLGSTPVGADAERQDGRWILVSFDDASGEEKECGS